MIQNPRDNPVLKRFRAAVRDIYGERVERVVLFSSRAPCDGKTPITMLLCSCAIWATA
jgi:hypothetical protein